ncbi:MAG: tetratricopeptide repeat protein [Aestuariivirga sp.]|nr:tetratricopeptide repeat protein [Aestuariivirga sp.]
MMLVAAGPSHAEFSIDEVTSLSGNYLAGRSAGKERDNEIAADYLAKALIKDPDNPLLIEKLFLLEVSSGNMPDAEELATKVLSFNSQHRMARIVLGLRDFRVRHYADARRNFAEASYTPVGELTSALLTAWTFAGEGSLNDALATLGKLDGNDSFANFQSYHSALIADYLSSAVRAEASYKKAYEQAGTSLRVVQAYGNFLERHNRRDEAIKVYQAFLEGGEENILIGLALKRAQDGKAPYAFIATPGAGAGEALFSLAAAMTDEQSIDVALLYAQLSVAFNADRPVVLTLLGDIYVDTKQYQNAINAYEQTPLGSPLRVNADMEIAINLQRLERTKEAQQKLKEIIAKDPRNYDALVTLGNVHRSNEEFKPASDTYSTALALVARPEKEHWRVLYYRGIAYERQKLWDKAEADFRQALALSPDEPLVLNYLGYSMIEKKMNLHEALGMVKKAVELKPNDGYIVDSLGWAYFQLGDYEEAATLIERAVDLNPADPIIGEHLGDAYWRVGRTLEARFQWQHAKDNGPQPEDLKRIEEKLLNGLPDEPVTMPAENKTGQTNG